MVLTIEFVTGCALLSTNLIRGDSISLFAKTKRIANGIYGARYLNISMLDLVHLVFDGCFSISYIALPIIDNDDGLRGFDACPPSFVAVSFIST